MQYISICFKCSKDLSLLVWPIVNTVGNLIDVFAIIGVDMKEIIVAASIMLGGVLLWIYLHRERPFRFREKPVLTGGELEFFFRLRDALPECVICPQVAVSALIEPVGVGPLRQKALACISGKRVGYAVFDEDMQLLAVAEYDHHGRRKRSDVLRDAWFASAGVRTIRFHAKHLPSVGTIKSRIFAGTETKSVSHYVDYRLNREVERKSRKTVWPNTANAHL